MRTRLLAITVVALCVLAGTAVAAVSLTATVKLSSNKVSTAKKPQSSNLVFAVTSCAMPSAACPQPQSLTLTGEQGMKVNGANLQKKQLCKLGSTAGKPDASTCKKKSQIGTGSASAFVAGLGPLSAPVTVYATTGTTKSKVAFAIFASVSGIHITIPGTVANGGGTAILAIPQLTLGPIAGLNPIVYSVELALDKPVAVKGKKSKRHLFGNPTVCKSGSWTFTVNEKFATDTGTAIATQACTA